MVLFTLHYYAVYFYGYTSVIRIKYWQLTQAMVVMTIVQLLNRSYGGNDNSKVVM